MKTGNRIIVAGAIALALALPVIAEAGQRGARHQSKTGQTQGQQLQIRERQRLQDGSCLDAARTRSGLEQRKGKAYGPGDGTGYAGPGPQDGTGNGAPGNR